MWTKEPQCRDVQSYKKKEPIVATQATNQPHKGQKNNSYVFHMYGLNGHKMTNSPRFAKMYRIFQGKNASSLKRKAVVNIKTITVDVNVVDIHVMTRRKITKRKSVP